MIGGLWTRDTVGWLIAAAALPVAVEVVIEQGTSGGLRAAIGLGVIVFWQAVFRLAAGAPGSPTAIVSALALALFLPPDTAFWHIALAASFGAVIGELVFGGWGRNFLAPGVVAVAFYALSFPNAQLMHAGTGMALAVLPGALILAVAGILSVPVLLGFAAVLALGAAGLFGVQGLAGVIGTLAFAAVFLVADPVASAVTAAGRWIHGGVAGGLTALLLTGADAPHAVIFAALLAAVFAPLIDQGVIAFHMYSRRRRTRHGRS